MKMTKFNINICSVQILQALPSLQNCPFKMADVQVDQSFNYNKYRCKKTNTNYIKYFIMLRSDLTKMQSLPSI